jgi:hypothetical protein
VTAKLSARLCALRLEEFDGVARWILDEDLAAARSLDDLTTKRRPLSSETLNGRIEIGSDDLEPIPPSRLRNATGFARATHSRLVEKQPQVIPRQTGESRGKGKVHMKPEAIAVEVDRLVDVCDEVPHGRMCHARFLRFAFVGVSPDSVVARVVWRVVLRSGYLQLWAGYRGRTVEVSPNSELSAACAVATFAASAQGQRPRVLDSHVLYELELVAR